MTETEAQSWLDACRAIFDGEGGYLRLPDGAYAFDPAPLRPGKAGVDQEATTAALISLLEQADRIEADEAWAHLLATGDWHQSLIEHLRRRANAGDQDADEALTARLLQKLAL